MRALSAVAPVESAASVLEIRGSQGVPAVKRATRGSSWIPRPVPVRHRPASHPPCRRRSELRKPVATTRRFSSELRHLRASVTVTPRVGGALLHCYSVEFPCARQDRLDGSPALVRNMQCKTRRKRVDAMPSSRADAGGKMKRGHVILGFAAALASPTALRAFAGQRPSGSIDVETTFQYGHALVACARASSDVFQPIGCYLEQNSSSEEFLTGGCQAKTSSGAYVSCYFPSATIPHFSEILAKRGANPLLCFEWDDDGACTRLEIDSSPSEPLIR